MRVSLIASVAAMCALALSMGPLASPASASPGVAFRKAAPRVSFTGADLVRVDRQDLPFQVRVAGVSGRVVADFGDGSRYLSRMSRCSPAKALAAPSRCSVSFSHSYAQPGSFTQRVKVSGRWLPTTRAVQVAAKPLAWRPPAGFVQPAGWAILDQGATYTPCQSVKWFFDHAGEPADRAGMTSDVQAAFAILAPLTKLTFTQVDTPEQANMEFNWQDTGGSAGLGGGADGYAEISFDPASDWTKDVWAGQAFVTREWDADGMHWTWRLPGRTWLAAHEIMHGLGLGHVNDKAELMNPTAGDLAALGPGDLDALATMYASQPCPVIPD